MGSVRMGIPARDDCVPAAVPRAFDELNACPPKSAACHTPDCRHRTRNTRFRSGNSPVYEKNCTLPKTDDFHHRTEFGWMHRSLFRSKLPLFRCNLTLFACNLTLFACKTPLLDCKPPLLGCEASLFCCKPPLLGCELPLLGCETAFLGCEPPSFCCMGSLPQ